MAQIVLPFAPVFAAAGDIVLGAANARVAAALAAPHNWPFGTAVLHGPPRSGKSLLARWFAGSGLGEAIDDAPLVPEAELFHRWNRAREAGHALLVVAAMPPWRIALPDLRSRLSAALHLEIGEPDDEMVPALIASFAAQRGLVLGADALAYLAVRAGRSWRVLERLVARIDHMCWEQKAAPGLAICRAALGIEAGDQGEPPAALQERPLP